MGIVVLCAYGLVMLFIVMVFTSIGALEEKVETLEAAVTRNEQAILALKKEINGGNKG